MLNNALVMELELSREDQFAAMKRELAHTEGRKLAAEQELRRICRHSSSAAVLSEYRESLSEENDGRHVTALSTI